MPFGVVVLQKKILWRGKSTPPVFLFLTPSQIKILFQLKCAFRKNEIKMRKFNTLKKNYEFKRVLNKGQYYYGKYIQFFIIKNNRKINKQKLLLVIKLFQIKLNFIGSVKFYLIHLLQQDFQSVLLIPEIFNHKIIFLLKLSRLFFLLVKYNRQQLGLSNWMKYLTFKLATFLE